MTPTRRSPHRIATRLGAAGAACVVAAVAFAPGAAADTFSDGQWYVSTFKLADNHTIADGSGVTIALLDGLIDPDVPALKGADIVPAASTPCVNSSGASPVTGTGSGADHATGMATMLVGQGGNGVALGVAPGAKLLTYTVGYGTTENVLALSCPESVGGSNKTDDVVADAIRDAVSKGARIVNMSFGGPTAQIATRTAILSAMKKGVVFVASTNDYATDQGSRLDPPASFNGVVAVNGVGPDGKLIADSATGDPDGPLVVASAPGGGLSLGRFAADGSFVPSTQVSGSSPATAFVSGALAVTLSHFPKATGNQLIQSLARNTGGEEHDTGSRALDGYGYGIVSLTSMLQHDPTAYPDENPTLRDGAEPSTAEILGDSGSSSPPSSSTSGAASSSVAPSTASTPVAAQDDGSSTGLFVGIGIGVVVLLAIVALVVVLLARRRGSGPPPGPGQGPPVTVGGHR